VDRVGLYPFQVALNRLVAAGRGGAAIVEFQRDQARNGIEGPRVARERFQRPSARADQRIVQDVRYPAVNGIVPATPGDEAIVSQRQVQLPEIGRVSPVVLEVHQLAAGRSDLARDGDNCPVQEYLHPLQRVGAIFCIGKGKIGVGDGRQGVRKQVAFREVPTFPSDLSVVVLRVGQDIIESLCQPPLYLAQGANPGRGIPAGLRSLIPADHACHG